MLFWDRLWENLPYFLDVLIPAAGMTVRIAAGAFVLAIVVGLLLALLQTIKVAIITLVVRTYIEIIRGTPVLAQLFILYFGLTEFGIRFTPVQAAILGLGLNGGAYLAEVFRAGIQSIHAGQLEAALTVGMTPLSAMRYVILPQALNVVVPPTTNYSIALLKDTAIVSAVAATHRSGRQYVAHDRAGVCACVRGGLTPGAGQALADRAIADVCHGIHR